MINRILFIVLAVFLSSNLFAQRSELIQQRIEFITEQLESEEIDLTNVVEQLNYYIEHPINLNNTTQQELKSLMILTDVQINDLIIHIKKTGKLISIYELQALKYWDLETIDMILPFIKVTDRLDQLHVNFKQALTQGKFEVWTRYQRVLEDRPGYEKVPYEEKLQSSKYYLGNPDKYYTRLRYTYRTNISIGVTAEKDAGEQFFRGTQKNGFDFYSAHVFYKGGKYVRAVALGDYQIQIGQGLNLWSGYAFGKTADVSNIKKSAQSIRAYTSVDETRFLRGGAVDLGVKDFSLTIFGSHKKIDGTSISDSLYEDMQYVSSINLSGFHRTTSELAKKNTMTEQIGGANLRYTKGNLHIGAAAVHQKYSSDFIRDEQLYNKFDFRGDKTTGFSADYNYVWKNINLFGEASYSTATNSTAMLQGAIIALDQKATLSLLYRDYDRSYYTFYNNGLSEGSKTQNEKGIYAGLKLKLNNSWTLNTYLDLFQQEWLKYLVNAPAYGNEFLFQPSYKPNKQMEVYARFRQQVRQKNISSSYGDGTVAEIEDHIQRNYRLNFAYQVTPSVQLKSRIEYITLDRLSKGQEKGMLFTQDIVIRPKSSPLDVTFRYAMFDTDSYDTRMYSFEANALYVFSVPSYYYQGSRAYVLLRYTFLKKCDLWVRYGGFFYTNRNEIGSGKDLITGNKKTDITVQLRIKF